MAKARRKYSDSKLGRVDRGRPAPVEESPFLPGTRRLAPGWRYPGGGRPPVKVGG